MSEHTGAIERLGITFRQLYVTAMVDGGILMANILDRNGMVVHADDALLKQTELAFPSALPIPQLKGPEGYANAAVDLGSTSISLLAAQRTSSIKGLAATAVGAQAAGCAVDAIADRSGWLTHTELSQEDVGFSSISVAWFTKFLLDKASRSKERATAWYTGLTVFVGTVPIGLPLYEGSQGGKLDATSHAAGLGVGLLAYKIGNWKANIHDTATRAVDIKN